MRGILTHLRGNVVAYIALFIALGGTSYAAFSLPAGSVGDRQIQNHAIGAVKLNPGSIAASVRAWADVTWDGVWRVRASSRDIQITRTALGEAVRWRHTRFARNCMASVTPERNFPSHRWQLLCGGLRHDILRRTSRPSPDRWVGSQRNSSGTGLLAAGRLSVAGEPEGWLMKRVGLFLATFVAALLICASLAAASYHVYVCGGWSPTAWPFAPAAAPGTQAAASDCGGAASATMLLAKSGIQAVPNGQGASWTASAPANLTITHIYTTNDESSGVGDGEGWWGEFFWQGGPGLAGRSAQLSDIVLPIRLLFCIVQQPDGRLVHKLRLVVMRQPLRS